MVEIEDSLDIKRFRKYTATVVIYATDLKSAAEQVYKGEVVNILLQEEPIDNRFNNEMGYGRR